MQQTHSRIGARDAMQTPTLKQLQHATDNKQKKVYIRKRVYFW